jgi:two-component system NtrC family sensor kinase
MRKSVAALFADAVCDPRLDAAESVAVQSIRASMCVPLKPKDAIVGVLYVDHLSVAGRFTEDDLDFLVAFASLAAIAVENAALYRRVEQEAGARMQLIMNAKLASLSAMAAGIAHELRNPLNFITNFAEASADIVRELEEDLSSQRAVLDPAVTASFAEALGSLRTNAARITEHGRRADGVIQGLVRHARRPTGIRESGDLNAVVAASVGLTRKWARLGELEVRVDAAYDPAIGPVQMSAADLGQVFINVVDNALYSMRQKKRARVGPAGGAAAPGADGAAAYAPELRVRTADRGDRAEVRIRDNGLGIPEDAVDRVFDPFFTTKPPGQGTGLGLSLSREIVVEGHRGSMRVETTLGEYAELVITLPKQGGSPSKR